MYIHKLNTFSYHC